MLNAIRVFLRWGACITMAGAALGASAQTAAVDLVNAPAGSAAMTPIALSNGVRWSVDKGGPWNDGSAINQGAFYTIRGTNGAQTFTFSETVDLRFEVSGFQGWGEGLALPAGTSCTVPNASFTWSSTSHVVQHINTYVNSDGWVRIPCTLNAVSALTVNGDGIYFTAPSPNAPDIVNGYQRGVYSISVARLNAITATFSTLPASVAAGSTVAATLTCQNTGPDALNVVSCVPSVQSGGGTVSNVMCSPAAGGAVASGASMVCTFDYTAPPTAGPVVFAGNASAAAGAFNNPVTSTTTAAAAVALAASGVQTVSTLEGWALGMLGALIAGVAALRRPRHQG